MTPELVRWLASTTGHRILAELPPPQAGDELAIQERRMRQNNCGLM